MILHRVCCWKVSNSLSCLKIFLSYFIKIFIFSVVEISAVTVLRVIRELKPDKRGKEGILKYIKKIVSYFRCAIVASSVLNIPRRKACLFYLELDRSSKSLISIHIIFFFFSSDFYFVILSRSSITFVNNRPPFSFLVEEVPSNLVLTVFTSHCTIYILQRDVPR